MASTKKNQPSLDNHIYDTFIVGAGISGIAAAIRLDKADLGNYKIIEKANRVGGTWRDNNYPGCGCDVPSALYSYSFAPSAKWSHLFAKQPEILNYLEEVSEEFGVKDKIEFNSELTSAAWQEEQHLWKLTTTTGIYWSKAVIFATGPITESQIPKLEGLDTFKGDMFHSARWNHDVDLKDKRIAVIGTGASAIQFIPQVQPLAKALYVFQRTAPWVVPKPDMPLSEFSKSVIAKYPALQQGWRKSVGLSLNAINFGLRNPLALKPFNHIFKQVLKHQIDDPQLLKDVTPNFTIGCKRLLFANNYYPALQASNTSLIPHGLVKVEGNTVISANGERHEVDVIIWGTGFDVSHPPIGKRVQNEKGQVLAELWKDSSPEAYLGTNIENVPNAFLMLGPNVLVYDSFIGLAEAQLDYIVDGLKQMRDKKISKLSIKADILSKHNQLVQKHLKTTVFNSGGCKSYYLDANGRNFAAWPWSLKKLKARLSHLDLNEYHVEYAEERRNITKAETEKSES